MSRYIRVRSLGDHESGLAVGRLRPLGRRGGFIRERIQARRLESHETELPPETEEVNASDAPIAGPFERRRERRYEPPPPTKQGRKYGPRMPLGPNMHLQAAHGFRAAVIELRPGLFVVAEVPEHTLTTDFGAAGLLAPLLIRSAAHALTQSSPRQPYSAQPVPTPNQAAAKTQPVTQQPSPSPVAMVPQSAMNTLVHHAVDTAVNSEPDPWAELSGQPMLPAPGGFRGAPYPAVPQLPAPTRWADAQSVAGVLGYPGPHQGGWR